ncbi:hypothetical protein BDV26DRAFT_255450 [Aspergillus bertholletiae]|uniref:Uncharacterized protein n=1 Tax=Aspergillus bertholletiae TaxID=1226010 RepID=A0A5N7BIG2_9EURO|nr:hypothetical protein BDV26DRAFT_255450 [Aspergillus bertholletiae]
MLLRGNTQVSLRNMRLLPLLALLTYLVPCLFVFAAWVPHSEGNQYGRIAIIEARATEQGTTATADAATGTTASVVGHATATANSTLTSHTATSATTATATLSTPVPTGSAWKAPAYTYFSILKLYR